MGTTEGDVQVSLKLVVSKETNRVLFAEANKDFVDVLFGFLTLPLGTIVRLSEKDSNIGSVTVGSLNSLYHSVEGLDHEYLHTQTCKEILLQPRNSSEDFCNTLKLNIDDTDPKKYFICSTCRIYCASPSTTLTNCWCGRPLTRAVFLKHSSHGFVNEAVTFVVTDDLTVMPISLDYTGLALLQSFGIKNPSSVTEKTVNVTKEKVLDLLKCFLLAKSSLTDVFLEKKPILKRPSFFSCSVEDDSRMKINIKLVIRKSDGKILYAQGEKDFADMLLSFLTFPLGVVGKLGGNCSLGSIDGLYKTILDLNEGKYFSKGAKNRLVDPHLLRLFELRMLLLPISKPIDSKYYCHKRLFHLQFFKQDGCPTNDDFTQMNLIGSESVTGSLKRFCQRSTSVHGYR